MSKGFSLNKNEVHLWFAYDDQVTDVDLLASYQKILSRDELSKCNNFYFQKHRHQYLITRALVRYILSQYMPNITPDEWVFKKNRYNKPSIDNRSLVFPLYFNLSHTEGMIALAVSHGVDIGIDVENTLGISEFKKIANNYFSLAEFKALMKLPIHKRQYRFYQLWTLKEAYIKACGMGLSIPLKEFSFSFPKLGKTMIAFEKERIDDPKHWQLWQMAPTESHIVSVAINGEYLSEKTFSLTISECIPGRSSQYTDCPIVARSSL